MNERNYEFIRGFKEAIPVMIGFIPFALVLGTQATQKGLKLFEVPLLTGSNFGGGSEFAAMAIWTNPQNLFLIIAVTFLVNSRHLLMGAVLAPHLKDLSKTKTYAALFFMCDESWAMGLADTQENKYFSIQYYFGVSFCLYTTWILFTTLGAYLGPVIGNIESYGFDMAFPAVFLVLLKGMWKGLKQARPWLVSLVVAALTYKFVGGAWYVPAGAISGILAAYIWAGEV